MRPLLLLAHLTLLPLCAWALLEMLDSSAAQRIALWLIACVIVHDLLVMPLYSGADRALRRVVDDATINYVRVPAGLSLLLLVVFWGTISGAGERAYRATSGQAFSGYETRWLLASAALFAGSAVVYLLRRGSRS
jgi:hypothetical protein